MIHELYPEYFHLWDPVAVQKQELVRKATHVIAISESTKRDLIDFYNVEESRITVTHLGSSFQAEGTTSNLNLPGKYLLMVGSRGTYKNCYFTVRALSRLLKIQPEVHVVFAGGGRFSDDEKRFFAELDLADRVHHFPASDADLRVLYGRAEAFIFPSLYEGFGIPVLEAFSCGCPVLASSTAALREVAGDGALYFDPKSPHELVAGVERILHEPALRTELKNLGSERLKQFSWDRCAAQTMAVYRQILEKV
jgi:glycosyltransferase involved in cell wall biosynthesis